MSEKFYGKYRGMVLNNIDPMQMGRLQVQVPDVAGLVPCSWAMPCVPIAGIQNGMFALPIIGSGVWVEFEQGNPEQPIWVGCFYGSGIGSIDSSCVTGNHDANAVAKWADD
jgi:hypothetical protein